MTSGGADSEALVRAWQDASARLPTGWRLDGIRCTSTGLAPGERGERWRAFAVHGTGDSREAVADDPEGALDELVRLIRSTG
ncbi:MAG: hypothetical protein K5924_03085 [Chloroflexi bacterium]|nr:hypothetical protein [Chloroflexota bacterium]